MASRLHFFQRIYPSANMVLITGQRSVLVDTGFGSDLAETERLVEAAGVPASQLQLIINTHYHCDHAGGNHGLQASYGIPIAAHRWDAALINQRDWEACAVEWLDQPIEAYTVNQALSEGDELDLGGLTLQVLHTPGHTLGHIALYVPEERCLLCGDVVHSDDVAWLGSFREGVGAMQRMMETLDRVAQLPMQQAMSGHGPLIEQPLVAIDAARRRYEKWMEQPEKLGWHACKRIFAYALMLRKGMLAEEIPAYLLHCAWFQDYARSIFRMPAEAFVAPFLGEMVRSRAAGWKNGRLIALAPHTPPPANWLAGPSRPKDW